jgi:hypothetical protein
MTLNSRDRMPTSAPPVTPAKRRATTAAQRFLLTVALSFACMAVTLVIARLVVFALIALAVTLVAVGRLLAGVRRKPGRRERSADTGRGPRLWRRRPGAPGPQTAKQHGPDSSEAGTGQEAAPALGNSGPPEAAAMPGIEAISSHRASGVA